MSRNVFTIFNHGTDFHRDRDPDELINALSCSVAGNEARVVQTAERTPANPLPFQLASANPSYLVCEGPGSDEVLASEAQSGVHHAHPGKYNPIFNSEKTRGKSHTFNTALNPTGGKRLWIVGAEQSSTFQDDFMGNTTSAGALLGKVLGRGWDDNVYKAVWMLTHLKWEMGQPIDTVNIVGWSRGAVTCLKMANKLFEVFEDTLSVNIFAIDPVPGGYNRKTADMLAIPPNVRNYLAILALDADGGNFMPTDRSQLKLLAPKSQHGYPGNPDSLNPQHIKPRVHFLPMPGNHSDVVNVALSSEAVKPSAWLCRHLAWQFLTAHHTPMTDCFDLSPDLICQQYEALMTQRVDIANAASSGGYLALVEGFKRERAVRAHRDDYVKDASTYLNEHHRLCALKQTYPVADPDETFTSSDWVPWHEQKMLALPSEQASLAKMGIATSCMTSVS